MKCKNCHNLHILTDITGENVGSWCPKTNDSPDIEIDRECDKYKGVTNADRIRNMSNGELSEWIHNIVKFQGGDMEPMLNIHDLEKEQDEVICDNYVDLLEWLQKEVE